MLTRFAALLRVQHPGITPMVLSMSSLEIETGLEDLSLDWPWATAKAGVGPPLRCASPCGRSIKEHYFLLSPAAEEQSQKPVKWSQAARLPHVF
jgi:hypothetical protein